MVKFVRGRIVLKVPSVFLCTFVSSSAESAPPKTVASFKSNVYSWAAPQLGHSTLVVYSFPYPETRAPTRMAFLSPINKELGSILLSMIRL